MSPELSAKGRPSHGNVPNSGPAATCHSQARNTALAAGCSTARKARCNTAKPLTPVPRLELARHVAPNTPRRWTEASPFLASAAPSSPVRVYLGAVQYVRSLELFAHQLLRNRRSS